MHQFITLVVADNRLGRAIKVHAVSHGIADRKIDHGAEGKIHNNFDQGIYLVLFSYRPHLEKGKPAMHGEHHDSAEHHEQHVAAVFQRHKIHIHRETSFFSSGSRARV